MYRILSTCVVAKFHRLGVAIDHLLCLHIFPFKCDSSHYTCRESPLNRLTFPLHQHAGHGWVEGVGGMVNAGAERWCTIRQGKLRDRRSRLVLAYSKLASICVGLRLRMGSLVLAVEVFFYRLTGGMFLECARVATWCEHG